MIWHSVLVRHRMSWSPMIWKWCNTSRSLGIQMRPETCSSCVLGLSEAHRDHAWPLQNSEHPPMRCIKSTSSFHQNPEVLIKHLWRRVSEACRGCGSQMLLENSFGCIREDRWGSASPDHSSLVPHVSYMCTSPCLQRYIWRGHCNLYGC